jgi:hypothetical protein
MSSTLTGKLTLPLQKLLIEKVRQWCDEIPPRDMIALRCESAAPDKQYRVWKKWLTTKEKPYGWSCSDEYKAFYFYKHVNLE